MKNILEITSWFIQLVFSINNGTISEYGELNEITNLDIQPTLVDNAKDFNYTNLSIESLANMKMPYINCNRKMFCNTEFDLIDLFNLEEINLKKELLVGENSLLYKIFFVQCELNKLILNLKNQNQQSDIYSDTIKILNVQMNSELVLFADKMKNNSVPSKPKSDIYRFLVELEKYFKGSLEHNLLFAFSTFKPSVFLLDNYSKEFLSNGEVEMFMNNIIHFYEQAYDNVENFKKLNSIIDQHEKSYTPGSYILTKNILFKWMDEVIRQYLIDTSGDIKHFDFMQLYSINVEDTLEDELTNIIKNIIDKKIYKKFETYDDSELYFLPKSAEDSQYSIKYHVLKASNNKRYIIKVLDLISNNFIPLGISTSYLNSKKGFSSLGYIGVSMISTIKFGCMFFSIEEGLDFYLSVMDKPQASIKHLNIFKDNIFQVSYFLLDFLDLLKSLFMFKIKLRSRLVFGVDISDNKRWKFRLDNIGYFSYSKNASLFENHKYLVAIIDEILLLLSGLTSVSIFKEFKRIEDELRNTDNQDYIIILSKLIENNMKTYKMCKQ